MKTRGSLIVLSGFAGVGKGTVLKSLFETHEGYAYSVSATTREPRPGEVDGVHYFFISKERFEQMIAGDELLEHACYVGNYYGTPRAFVEENRGKGIDVILEIEVQGALQVKRRHPEAVMIFITTPNAREMERRLTNRKTDSYEKITSRMERAVVEAEHMKEYDYVVINDILDDCVRTIEEIIVNEPAGPRYDPKFKERFVQSLKEIIIERKNCTEFGEM